MTSATIGDIIHGVQGDINHIILYERCFSHGGPRGARARDFVNFRKHSPAWRARGARVRVYLYFNSFSGFPGSDKCQHRKWPLAHERPRVTQKFPSGVIHQKLRLELIQHAGYL